MNDTELLQSFARDRSETAFRALVERYLPLVLSTARRISGNPSLAEDVAQAVFVLLAKKAATLGPKVIISAWLYRTASFVSKRALASESRRQKRELEALTMQSLPDNAAWENVTPALDSAMASLGETDRTVILLRYFEQQSYRDVGLALGLSEEAAKKRGSRALDKLRSILGRRGIEISLGVLATGLAQESAHAGGGSVMAGKIVASVLAQGTAGAGVTTGAVLVNEALAAWRWAKIKLAMLSATGLVLTAMLILQISKPSGSAPDLARALETNTLSAVQPIMPARLQVTEAGLPTQSNSIRTLQITVLDAETSKPIKQASVFHDLLPWKAGQASEPLRTDSNGVVNIDLPTQDGGHARLMQYDVQVNADGFAGKGVKWMCTMGNVLGIVSTQYVVQLERGISVSGMVVNEKGEPQQKVKVSAYGNNCPPTRYSIRADGSPNGPANIGVHEYDNYSRSVETDAEGRFEFRQFPSQLLSLVIECKGPTGSKCSVRTSQGARLRVEEMALISVDELKRGVAKIVLPDGVSFEGTVVNIRGEPVADAAVLLSSSRRGPLDVIAKAQTDHLGRFRMEHCPAQELILSAAKDGWATAVQPVFVKDAMPKVRLQLAPERPIRGRVVDPIGKPIAGARVNSDADLHTGMGVAWAGVTDRDGRFMYRGAPTNELKFGIHADGFGVRTVYLTGSEEETVISMSPAGESRVHITGHVTDANSGLPIERFKIKISHEIYSPGIPRSPARTVEATNGEMDFTIRNSDVPPGQNPSWILQIEADRYDCVCTRVYDFSEGDQQLDFCMQPGGTVGGVVLKPDGGVADGASIGFAQTAEAVALFKGTKLSNRYLSVKTGEDGRFNITKPITAHAMVVVHHAGWAVEPLAHSTNQVAVRLKPWGRIEGTVMRGGQVGSNASVYLKNLTSDWANPVSVNLSAIVRDGHFVFECVPTGEYRVAVESKAWNKRYMTVEYERQAAVRVQSGETQTVRIGGEGVSVEARLQLPGGGGLDCTRVLAILSRDVAMPPEPNRWDYLNNENHLKAHREWCKNSDVLEALRAKRDYVGEVEADGTVTFEDVQPGRYRFSAKLLDLDQAEETNGNPPVLWRFQTTVLVPETSDGDSAQLGKFVLEPM